MVPVVSERAVEHCMHRRQVVRHVRLADVDPARWRAGVELSREIDAHVPEVPDEAKAAAPEQDRRGLVARVHRVPQAGAGLPADQLERPCLDPIEQRRADAPSAVRRMDHTPRSGQVRLVTCDLAVAQDRPRAVDCDPGVGRQDEAGSLPLTAKEARVQDDPAGVIQVVRRQDGGRGWEVVPSRLSQLECAQ